MGDQYYSYSVCIAVITWFSIISAAVEAHQNMKRLAEIAHFTRWVRGSVHGVKRLAEIAHFGRWVCESAHGTAQLGQPPLLCGNCCALRPLP